MAPLYLVIIVNKTLNLTYPTLCLQPLFSSPYACFLTLTGPLSFNLYIMSIFYSFPNFTSLFTSLQHLIQLLKCYIVFTLESIAFSRNCLRHCKFWVIMIYFRVIIEDAACCWRKYTTHRCNITNSCLHFSSGSLVTHHPPHHP